MKIINYFYKHYQKFKKNIYKNKVKKVAKSVGKDLKVNGYSYISPKTKLGNNVNFNGMKIQGHGNVSIGDNFHSGIDCMIITDIHNYNEGKAIPYDETIISKDVTIKDNVWLGNRVLILPGVTIEEGAVLQAGSVVVNNIPKYGVAGGNPAKIFKNRDIEHYEKLKKEKKFH